MLSEVNISLDLIRSSYGEEAALKYSQYILTNSDASIVVNSVMKTLAVFPDKPYCCLPMSAFWVAHIRDTTNIPIHLVAGNLVLNELNVFGGTSTIADLKTMLVEFSDGLAWDGHCWIVIDSYIGDASFFRTAYKQDSNHWLRKSITNIFGENKGLLFMTPEDLKKYELVYCPQYIFTDDQVTGLVNGALTKVV